MAKFNKFVLRRLYHVDHEGRGEQGVIRRHPFKVTIRPTTFLALRNAIDVGKGQYGSPVVELALRVILTLVGEYSHEERTKVCEELVASVDRPQEVAQMLVFMAVQVQELSDTVKVKAPSKV